MNREDALSRISDLLRAIRKKVNTMQTTTAEEMSCLLRECVQQLSAIEAAFIGDCHLSEPRKSLKAFAEEHGLKPMEMADLRVRAIGRLREELAARKVYELADIL